MTDTGETKPARASALLVRDLTEADLTRVGELEREIFGASAWSPTLIAEEFKYGFSRWRAVDVDGELVAYAVYGFEGDAFHLMNLVVDPAARRLGIGRALMVDLLAEARHLKVPDVWLEVAVTNTAALALYRAHGFEDVRVRTKYYQPEGLDAQVMRLKTASLPER